jgi:hypothetical protein
MTIRKAEDFGRWYSELVVKSEMIDYSDISGALRAACTPHYRQAQCLASVSLLSVDIECINYIDPSVC